MKVKAFGFAFGFMLGMELTHAKPVLCLWVISRPSPHSNNKDTGLKLLMVKVPRVAQKLRDRAKIPHSRDWMASKTVLLAGEGSWSWSCFSLVAHHSNLSGSYSDDRNKVWPQSPAIQLHNPSTSTLSQKDNNVNILILPLLFPLQTLISPGKEREMRTFLASRDLGARSCVLPGTRSIKWGHVPLMCLWPNSQHYLQPNHRQMHQNPPDSF